MTNLSSTTSQLIPVFLGQIGGIPAHVCDARELHSFLEAGKHFASWIQERIDKYGFEENKDFDIFSKSGKNSKGRDYEEVFPKSGKNPKGGRPTTEYHLSLDMAKELSMVENNQKGRQARRYFIDMEKKALAASGQAVFPSHQETLTPSEQQTLSEIAHRRAETYGELQGKVLAQIWSRVHRKFRISKYSLLPRTQLADAILYVIQMNIRPGKANALPPAKRYHYPRQLLEQPEFTAPELSATWSVSMLANTKEFVSPLFALLNELRTDGHEVSAPWDEAVAMREGLRQVDQAMEEAIHGLWNSRFAPASTAENT